MFSAVLFDHDGTLVDSEKVHFELWSKAVAAFGVTITEQEYIDEFLGIPADENARLLIRKHSLSISVDDLLTKKDELGAAFIAQGCFPACAYANELVAKVAERVPCGIVSGAQRFFVMSSVAAHGWEPAMKVIVTADEVANNKPAPEGYLKGMKALGVNGDSCVALEDTATGLKAALAAGMSAIAIRHAFNATHDFSQATVVVDSLEEAWHWLESRLAA